MDFSPDTIYTNGTIVTVDPDFSIASAFACYDGKFVGVGTDADVKSIAGQNTRQVNLHGRTVLPGLIDNHVHYIFSGLERLGDRGKVNISRLTSIDEIVVALKNRAQQVPAGTWIASSCMYRGPLKEGRFPDRNDLDKVSTEHPIYIFQSGKNMICNSLALQYGGIDRDSHAPSEPEGWIVKDESGEPTGHLIAGGADMARTRWFELVGRPPKKWDFIYWDEDTNRDALLAQQRIFHSAGVVAVREMGAPVEEIDTFVNAHRAGELKTRVDLFAGLPARYMSREQIHSAVASYFGPKQGIGDDMLRWAGIKLVVANDGYWSYLPDKLVYLIDLYHQYGWSMAIHLGSPEAGRAVLESLERVHEERPIDKLRISFEHGYGALDPDMWPRMKKLGIVIAPNPQLAYYAAERSAQMREALNAGHVEKAPSNHPLDAARTRWGLPLRSWQDSGLVVTGGTDSPGTVLDPDRPFLGHYAALTGNTLAGQLLPDETINREQMIRMWTTNGAYASFADNRRGAIAAGQIADFVVLDDNILTCDAEDIANIHVMETYVGDELVFARH
jgi:predicted amidohydrolase YtcJ